jgi:hypothetical protein
MMGWRIALGRLRGWLACSHAPADPAKGLSGTCRGGNRAGRRFLTARDESVLEQNRGSGLSVLLAVRMKLCCKSEWMTQIPQNTSKSW